MRNKVGLQIQSSAPDFDALLAQRPASVKLFNPFANVDAARRIRDLSPETQIVLRWADGDQDTSKPGNVYADGAARFFEPFLQAGVVDWIEHVNEPGCQTVDQAKQLNQHAVEYCRLMHSRGFGRVIVYNMSVGVPKCRRFDGNLSLWPYLVDGIRAGEALGLHEYSAPRMTDRGDAYCLRYRHVLDELRGMGFEPSVAVTECGIDRGVIAGQLGGYAHPENRTTVGDYMMDLSWYAGQLAQDAQVLFAHVFGYGMGEPWSRLGFDVAMSDETRAAFRTFVGMDFAGAPPVQPPASGGGAMATFEQTTLNAAWGMAGVAFNPDAAFYKFAQQKGAGRPVTNEFRFDYGGRRWAGQGFAGGIVQCVEGDWAHCVLYDWLTGKAIDAPATEPPASGGGLIFPPVLSAIGAIGEEGKPVAGQPFYRLTGATVRTGVSAFCTATVYRKSGAGLVPAIGAKVVNLFPDGNGEVFEANGAGQVTFNYAASSAFSQPGAGPFTVFVADDNAWKDSDSVPKRIVYAARLSDIVHSLGDWQGTHTEISLQFVEL